MDITDTIPQPTALDDDHGTPVRRDPRQVIACFAVCALAATAVFLVARSDHPSSKPAPKGPAPTSTTVARQPRSAPRPEAGVDRGATDDSTGGFFEQMFGDRLDGVAGDNAPQRGTTTSAPRAEDPGSAGVAEVGGRRFTIAYPKDWSASTVGDTYEIGTGDGAGGVSVAVGDTPSDGYRFEQWANEWEASARAQLIPDLDVVERGTFRAAGLDGFRLQFTGTVAGEHLRGEMWWLGDGDSVWILSQGFTAGDKGLAAACDRIARSFRPAGRS